MQVTSEQQRQWMKDTGMAALKPEEGIRAFYQAWATHWPQVMVLSGNRDKLDHFVNEQEEREKDASFYLDLIDQIASDELSEEQFMQLLQSHHHRVKTLG